MLGESVEDVDRAVAARREQQSAAGGELKEAVLGRRVFQDCER